jgi:hypothetical protein
MREADSLKHTVRLRWCQVKASLREPWPCCEFLVDDPLGTLIFSATPTGERPGDPKDPHSPPRTPRIVHPPFHDASNSRQF